MELEDRCSCAHNSDGSTTTTMCPTHADRDPCYTMALVTGRRRKGSIVRGVCTNCGWSEMPEKGIDQEEFRELLESHYTGGPFNGHDCLGYIGHSERNYITDRWLFDGANALGWNLADLDAWLVSKEGRWTLEGHIMDAREFQDNMAACDPNELLARLIA